MKIIGPIIIIFLAGAAFFWLTDPILNEPLSTDPATGKVVGGVFPLLRERADLNTALANSAKLQNASRDLVQKYNSLSETEKARIDKILPDRIDNVQLVIDINSIADKYGMTIQNIQIRTEDEPSVSTSGRTTIRRTASPGGESTAFISFTVTGSYSQLRNFLTDLARSLRLVDVTELAFAAGDQDLYQFSVKLRTYWLK